MVHDWLPRSRPPNVDDLVAKGRYKQAGTALRTQFEGRSPTLAERLRLADLLVLADHGEQAFPILLGVADELARYGFSNRALEKVDQIRKHRAGVVAPLVSQAASEAAFRVWVASLAQGTNALLRAAAPAAVEEDADRRGHE